MKKIAKTVLNKSASLVDDGKVSGSLQDAQKVQQQFLNESQPFIEEIISSNQMAMAGIESAIDKEFKSTGLKEYDDVSLEVLKEQIDTGFNAVISESMRQVGELMYDAVMSNMAYDDFVDQFENILGPDNDPDFFIRNAQMNYYQSVHVRKAELAGLDEFLYYGNIMGSSRAWCIVRVGQVFTRDQINSWSGNSWKGKSCAPMICRGGYNCRHHWRPVRKSWISEGRIKPQSFFDENDNEIPPALQKEIDKELAILNKSVNMKKKTVKKSDEKKPVEKETKMKSDDIRKNMLKVEKDNARKKALLKNGLIKSKAQEDKLMKKIDKLSLEDRDDLYYELDKLSRKTDKIRDAIENLDKNIHGSLKKMIAGKKKLSIENKGLYLEKTEEWFDGILDIEIPEFEARKVSGRGRAYASRGMSDKLNSINVNAYDTEETKIHEIGHIIEFSDPEIKKKANDFLEKRTKGDKPKKLRDVTGIKGYGDKEITKEDKFFDPYVGKIYRSGDTEIVSMGLQRLYEDPVGFAVADPEYFDLIIDIIRGM